MPELPEVQTMASDLARLIKRKQIADVWFDTPSRISLISNDGGRGEGVLKRFNLAESEISRKLFKKSLIESKVVKVGRRAKNILIFLSGGKLLLVHPKMTGHLIVGKWTFQNGKPIALEPEAAKAKVNSYIHFLIKFSDGSMLGFSDARKFGKILFAEEELVKKTQDLSSLGPEPLETKFDFNRFKKILDSSKGKIKLFLLDQRKIAGIGNIYADEILWNSKVNPLARVSDIGEEKKKAIFSSIKDILSRAVKYRGTSKTDYRDAAGLKGAYEKFLKVYGKSGQKCPRCGAVIKRIVINGRSASFCPNCQKL